MPGILWEGICQMPRVCRRIREFQEGKAMEKKLKVIVEKCPRNHACPSVGICPVGALSQDGFNAPVVDHDKCIRCGKCAEFCPKMALVLEEA